MRRYIVRTCYLPTIHLLSDKWCLKHVRYIKCFGKTCTRLERTLRRWSFDGFEISLKPNGSRCAVILNQCWKVTTLINCIYANGRVWFTVPLKVKNGAIVFPELPFSLFFPFILSQPHKGCRLPPEPAASMAPASRWPGMNPSWLEVWSRSTSWEPTVRTASPVGPACPARPLPPPSGSVLTAAQVKAGPQGSKSYEFSFCLDFK